MLFDGLSFDLMLLVTGGWLLVAAFLLAEA